jgi:membrane dipeptidase
MRKILILYLLLACMISCTEKKQTYQLNEADIEEASAVSDDEKPLDLAELAQQLSRELIIVDGHVDLPYRLRNKMEDVSKETAGGHFDYVRAKKGGLDAPFMSIYIPAAKENNGAMDLAIELMASVEKLCTDHPGKFARADTPAEIEANFANGLISFPMGLENGAPVEGKLENLDFLYKKGIRYITLCHSKDNHICDSSYDQQYTHGGLSHFGYEVIKRMNELGMMVDVSHVSDSAFYQVLRISKAPVIASHSSCRHFTPGFERNVSDDMIRLMGEKGGIIMINFGSAFITSAGTRALRTINNKIADGADPNDPIILAEMDSIKNSPQLMGDVAMVADHIDRMVQIAGIDHVGLGSDFDGVSNLPIGLEDASKLPDLILELLKRGYSEEDIAKICYKNIFRVWNEVIEVAEKLP